MLAKQCCNARRLWFHSGAVNGKAMAMLQEQEPPQCGDSVKVSQADKQRRQKKKADELVVRDEDLASWEKGCELIGKLCNAKKVLKASLVFDRMDSQGKIAKREQVPSSLVIGLFRSLGAELALEHYRKMAAKGYTFAPATNSYVLGAVRQSAGLDKAYEFVMEMVERGSFPATASFYVIYDLLLKAGKTEAAGVLLNRVSCLLDSAGYRCFICRLVDIGGVFEAVSLYEQMIDRGFISDLRPVHKALIRGLLVTGRHSEGLEMFGTFVDIGGVPTGPMYGYVIKSLCKAHRLDEAWELYQDMSSRGESLMGMAPNTLILMLVQEGRLDNAFTVLKGMLDRGMKPDYMSYNSTLEGFWKQGREGEARELFNRVREAGLGNTVTFSIMMNGLFLGQQVDEALEMFKTMEAAEIPANSCTYSTVIGGLCKAGRLEAAEQLFQTIVTSGQPVTSSVYSTFIDGLCKADKIAEAQGLLNKVVDSGRSLSSYAYNSLMDALCKSGRLEDAIRLFDRLAQDGIEPHAITYGIVMDGLFDAKRDAEAKDLFNRFVAKGNGPSGVTYGSLVRGACKKGDTDEACRILDEMLKTGCISSPFTYSIVIDALCKADKLDQASLLFNSLLKNPSVKLDMVGYSNLMNGYCDARRVEEAKKVLRAFVDGGGKPDIVMYTVLVKGLCKAGKLDEALKLLEVEMKAKGFPPGAPAYNIVIGALNSCGRYDEAQQLFERFVKAGGQPSGITFSLLRRNFAEPRPGWRDHPL